MRIDIEFTVAAPVERVWELFTDVEAVAPCMPGVRLTGVPGGEDRDVYAGTVRVKVGTVVAAYECTGRFAELDAEQRHAVIEASGKPSRGTGNASASVTLRLREASERTAVSVSTDLSITGKHAQLEHGTVKDESDRLLVKFVECVEDRLAAEQESPTEDAAATGSEAASAAATGSENNERTGTSAQRTERLSSPDLVTASGNGSGPQPSLSLTNENTDVNSDTSANENTDAVAEAPTPEQPAVGSIAQRVWPIVAVVVVMAGIFVGYALFG